MSTCVIWYKTQPEAQVASQIDKSFCNIFGRAVSHDVTAYSENLASLISKVFTRANTVVIVFGANAVLGNENIISHMSHIINIPLDKKSRSQYFCDTINSYRLPSLSGSILFPSRFGGPEGVLLQSGHQTILLIPSEKNSAISITVSIQKFLATSTDARYFKHETGINSVKSTQVNHQTRSRSTSYTEEELRIQLENALNEMRESQGIIPQSYVDDYNRGENNRISDSNRDTAYFYYRSRKRKIGGIVSTAAILTVLALVLIIGYNIDFKTFASNTKTNADNSSVSSDIISNIAANSTTATTTENTSSSKADSKSKASKAAKKTNSTTAKKAASATTKQAAVADMRITVNGEIVTGSAVDILSGIIEAEMGSDSQIEALKAQAVAAYTYYLYCGGRDKAPSFPSKTSGEKARLAASAVEGIKMTYNGKAAYTPYYAISAGKTASNSSINGTSLTYLKSVDCGCDKNAEGFKTVNKLSSADVAEKVKSTTGIDLSSREKSQWFDIIERDENNLYVKKVLVGENTYTGSKLWLNVLGYKYIRSACYYIDYDSKSDTFSFTSLGYGHGVGMSQAGANYYASDGKDYKWILKHFYSGVTI